MMDYFWNRRSRSHREHVPTAVIYWLEGERDNSDRRRIDFELSDLEIGNCSNLHGREKDRGRRTRLRTNAERYSLTHEEAPNRPSVLGEGT
jgi:hypothetical protein